MTPERIDVRMRRDGAQYFSRRRGIAERECRGRVGPDDVRQQLLNVPDISKIQALIEYQPRLGLDDIIRTVVEHMRQR